MEMFGHNVYKSNIVIFEIKIICWYLLFSIQMDYVDPNWTIQPFYEPLQMEKQSSMTPYSDRIYFRYVMPRLNTEAELRISFYDAQIVNKNLF